MNRQTVQSMLLAALLSWVCPAVAGDWRVLGEESNVAFVTVKNGTVAEAHTFNRVSGVIHSDGTALIEIDLASVDTRIPIRDERMRKLLFAVDEYPKAVLTATLDLDAFAGLAAGESVAAEVEGSLQMHGASVPLGLDVWVTRLTPSKIRVSSRRPVIVNAEPLGLSGGIEALREIAGLASITPAVPVSFNLTLVEASGSAT